jgi:hypothetical protein
MVVQSVIEGMERLDALWAVVADSVVLHKHNMIQKVQQMSHKHDEGVLLIAARQRTFHCSSVGWARPYQRGLTGRVFDGGRRVEL